MFWRAADNPGRIPQGHTDSRPEDAASRLRRQSAMGDGIFSLGGLLARWWKPRYPLLPWAFTSAMLTCAAMWDFWSRGGPIDYAVLGLAAYELMLGLLEERTEPVAVERRASRR
jgi:hypothetical protein